MREQAANYKKIDYKGEAYFFHENVFAKVTNANQVFEWKYNGLFRNFVVLLQKNNMVFLTRRERFNAAHRLFCEDFSDEKNLEVFGKCSNPNWHGHNYELFVTVCGPVDPDTGFVINIKILSDIIIKNIIDKIDHKNINLEVDFMMGRQPSAENIAVAIWEHLTPFLAKQNAKLHCIKLCETENNFVEYFGD